MANQSDRNVSTGHNDSEFDIFSHAEFSAKCDRVNKLRQRLRRLRRLALHEDAMFVESCELLDEIADTLIAHPEAQVDMSLHRHITEELLSVLAERARVVRPT